MRISRGCVGREGEEMLEGSARQEAPPPEARGSSSGARFHRCSQSTALSTSGPVPETGPVRGHGGASMLKRPQHSLECPVFYARALAPLLERFLVRPSRTAVKRGTAEYQPASPQWPNFRYAADLGALEAVVAARKARFEGRLRRRWN
jgi:hypothetical protein